MMNPVDRYVRIAYFGGPWDGSPADVDPKQASTFRVTLGNGSYAWDHARQTFVWRERMLPLDSAA